MSLKARIYILTIILAGILLLLKDLAGLSIANPGLLVALSLLATLTLIFKVEGATNRSHYSINFLVYAFAFVVLGAGETAIVILISNVVEWVWHRYKWYIQSFNIGNYLICLSLSAWVYERLNPGHHIGTILGVVSILAALAMFTLMNHLLVGLVLWLARGESFRKSGIFQFFPLSLDYILFCMGAGAAFLWSLNPVATILILLPQYLIYTTLKVPALERQSETDAKTGLFNARYFDQALNSELKRANRFDRPLTVVMADLDLLRNINNTYGHLAGDEVLKGVATILRSSVREYDQVARFGGEEFSILMPETRPEEAYPRIEAIRTEIEKTGFSVNTSLLPIRVTMSFGIAGRMGFEEKGNEIIHHADAALYHAKLRGRNGTLIYDEDGITDNSLHEGQAKSPGRPGEPLQAAPGSPPVSRPEAVPQVNERLSFAAQDSSEESSGNPSTRGEKKEKFSWLTSYYLAISLLSIATLAFGYQVAGALGVLVVASPLVLLHYSQKRYFDRTRKAVNDLMEKNNALERSTAEIKQLNDGLLNTLAEVVDLRDPHVLGHSKQVATYAVMLARVLSLPPKQVELVRKAGLLHDIGKMGVKESILFKPASLTPGEYSKVKEHVLIGAEILEKTNSLNSLTRIIRHHHEHFDGSGYPDGLRGNEIPLEARILALADAIEAMASDRPYKRSRTQEEILDEIQRHAGTQFDPLLVRTFVELVKLTKEPVILNSSLLIREEKNIPLL